MRCHSYWGAVCRQGPCGPLRSLEPWVHWIPPDLHGFYTWVLDALGCSVVLLGSWLNFVGILGCVVGPIGCERIWGLGPTHGSSPILYLPLHFLVMRGKVAKISQILLSRISLSFVRHGCRFSADCNLLTLFFSGACY